MTMADDDPSPDDDLLQRLRAHARRISQSNALLRRGLQLVAVVAPLLAGGIAVFTDGWDDSPWKATADVAQIAFLLAAVLCSGWLLIADDTSPELIHDAQEAQHRLTEFRQDLANNEEEFEFLEEELEWSALLYLTVAAMRRAVDTALVEPADDAAREKRLYVLLDLLVANKNALFGIGDSNGILQSTSTIQRATSLSAKRAGGLRRMSRRRRIGRGSLAKATPGRRFKTDVRSSARTVRSQTFGASSPRRRGKPERTTIIGIGR